MARTGKPRHGTEKKRAQTLMLPPKLIAAIKRAAKKKGKTLSAFSMEVLAKSVGWEDEKSR